MRMARSEEVGIQPEEDAAIILTRPVTDGSHLNIVQAILSGEWAHARTLLPKLQFQDAQAQVQVRVKWTMPL